MLSMVSKVGPLSPYLKTRAQVVASGLKPLAIAIPGQQKKMVTHVSATLSNCGFPKGTIIVKSGVTVTTQIRCAHSDLRVPDFSDYRRDGVKNAARKDITSESRKSFTYLLVGSSAVVGAYSAKAVVTQFVSSMSATADVLALAKIEVKLSDIPEGKSVTFKWRGKPLFIRHRTGNEISAEQAVAVNSLRDPQEDKERVQKPEWLVVLGVCTHLGCVPIANAGDFGGYYCPCHGSHYDASGRIRKGPAPLNLEVPYYEFPDETTLIVG